MSAYQCPTCGSGDIRRLQVIYQGGLSEVNTMTTGVVGSGNSGFGGGTARTQGYSQTVESQQAAPPPPKPYKPGVALAVGGVLALIVGFSMDSASGMLLLFFLAVCVFGGWQLKEAKAYNSAVWPDLYRKWEATYKCLRCGNTFALP